MSRCWKVLWIGLPGSLLLRVTGWLLLAAGGVAVATQPAAAQVDEIDTKYGRISGTGYRNSVNGTRFLAKLFRANGARVRSWSRLSPRIEKANVLVWFPDDYSPPSSDACTRLERWLTDEPGRVLIYVGRDFDGEVAYWEDLLQRERQASAPDRDRIEAYLRQLAFAKARVDERRFGELEEAANEPECRWFQLTERSTRLRETQATGPWASWIQEPVAVDLQRSVELQADANANPMSMRVVDEEVLLATAADEPLVQRWTVDAGWAGTSEAIFVSNGAFLLNYGLTREPHRRLAEQVVQESLGSAYGEEVLFLQTGPQGAEVLEVERPDQQATPWDWMAMWPLSFVVPHLFLIALVFCFAFFPIFGRPREQSEAARSDFGEHIRNLGKLFARTRDDQYMLEQIRHYQEHVRRDSGVSHQEAEPDPKA